MGSEDNPFAAGLGFAVDKNKDDFIGKRSLFDPVANPGIQRCVLLSLHADHPLLLHDEPVYAGKTLVGRTTSGGLGFRTDKALSIAWIQTEFADSSDLMVDLGGMYVPATRLIRPPYDPSGYLLKRD